MGLDTGGARAERFAAYIGDLASVIGDPRRHRAMSSYCTGLLMPADRKSVEPMAAMTLRANITFTHLVHMTKLRWRIERDYLELKQEIGLGHFEGRGWRGFHHHATLCIAAYGFLVSERAAFPASKTPAPGIFEAPAPPEDYRPRGAPEQNAASRAGLDRDIAP